MSRIATTATAAAAAMVALLAYASLTLVPKGSVAVTSSGDGLQVLRPGFHLQRPFAAPATIYPVDLPPVKGRVGVTLSDGPTCTLDYEIAGVLDPDKAVLLHRASSGRGSEGLLHEVAERVIAKAAAARTTEDLVAGRMTEGALQRARSLLLQAGLSDVVLKVEIRHPETIMNLARILARARLAGTLHDTAAAALAAEPGSWEAHTAMGLVLESQRDLRGAETHYLDALTIQPAALPPMAQLVALYRAVREFEKLDRILTAAVAADPNSAQHYNWLGASQMSQGRLPEARATLERALAIEPSNLLVLNNLGGVLLKQGLFDDAIEAFGKAVRASPLDRQSLYNLGVALAGSGRPQEGLRHLLAAEAAGEPGAPLLRAIAGAYRESGQPAKARPYEERARQAEAPPPAPPS